MKRIGLHARAGWRLGRALVHIMGGVGTIVWTFPQLSTHQREERVNAWALSMLDYLAIKLVVKGQPPAQGPVMLVANHISWLDIVVMHAARHCRFVSKAELRHWPLIGSLACGAGTLFIERESRRDAMRVVHHMAERLSAGDVLAIFPEGTTSDGLTLLPFHANLFQAAIASDTPVMPLALSFVDAASAQQSFAPCYVNDDTLIGSIWRTLMAPPLCAVVAFGEPQTAQGRDRRTWAADVRAIIGEMRAPK